MYHKAPELLSGETATDLKACDIYSLAILNFQILFRQAPYEGTHLTRAGTVRYLRRSAESAMKQKNLDIMNQIEINALRPSIPDVTKDSSPSLIEIMKKCWVQDWKLRPNIVAVKSYILKFNKKFVIN